MGNDLWGAVLAAGSGRRLASVTRGTPKQFWRADGRPSLLEDTFARLAPLAPPNRTTVVVDHSHRCFVEPVARSWSSDWVLYQPEDRGTAVGALLALSPLFESSMDAVVLLTPSDHGIADSASFRAAVHDAAAVVRAGQVDIVLFGVESASPVTDYGWIVPGQRYCWARTQPLRPVMAFVEKPNLHLARRLFAARALWNTMVIVARAGALLRLYETHLPHWAEVFAIHQQLPNHQRQAFLAEQYATLPSADFSRDLLTPAPGLAVYSWRQSIGWSDLGTPDRLQRWLGRQGDDNSQGLDAELLATCTHSS